MSMAINKILLSLSFIMLFTLFIGIYADDVADPDHLTQIKHNDNPLESDYYMAKKPFLPARYGSHQHVGDDSTGENEEDESHLNAKRYFLMSKRYFLNSKRYFLNSKRYFLNSKRNNERREED